MKKFLALILALVMSLSLVACGGGSNDAQGSGDDATATGKVYYLNFKPEQDEDWQNLAKAYTEETGVPVTVVTAASGTYEETLMADMAKAAGAILEDVKLFDVYRSAALGADMKSVAFAFVFRGADRTLTEQEITAAMDKILKVAAEKYNAVIRS